MGNIYNFTIFQGGRFTLEQTRVQPQRITGNEPEDTNRRPKEVDMARYSGTGNCVQQIQRRFGHESQLYTRDKCGKSDDKFDDTVWDIGEVRVESAMRTTSAWLEEYRSAVLDNYGVPVDQFDNGGIYGSVKVNYIFNEHGRINALEFTSARTGITARVEDSHLFEFLWTTRMMVAKK